MLQYNLLEQQRAHSAHFTLLFDKNLKVLIDDSYSKQYTSPTANST